MCSYFRNPINCNWFSIKTLRNHANISSLTEIRTLILSLATAFDEHPFNPPIQDGEHDERWWHGGLFVAGLHVVNPVETPHAL